MNVSQSLLAAAFGGMVLGATTACGGGAQSAPGPAMQNSQAAASATPMETAGAKHECKGQNDCKGRGGCKTDKHDCKGHNDCKGQGGCKA